MKMQHFIYMFINVPYKQGIPMSGDVDKIMKIGCVLT